MTTRIAVSTSEETPAQAIERELREFSYTVSHDLAAPFRHIKGFSELLLKDDAADHSPDETVYIEHIRTAAEKGARMVEQLLVYAHAQQTPLDLVKCDAMLLLDTVRLQLGDQIRHSGAEIAIGAIGEVFADQELLVQAFRQVLENAIKFRRPDVPPRVTVEPIEDPHAWKMQIIDNGIGLPTKEHEKAFLMFYRGHAEGVYPGVGAGLTIARRILRRHGGDMTFVARPSGTCLELSLPGGCTNHEGVER
jgi:light-regulated signal transduction histidine kinase (bacteriophytochrome)